MADLISREALLSELEERYENHKKRSRRNVGAGFVEYHKEWAAMAMGVAECLDVVRKLPVVDAVEVVRCKDCKYIYCLSAVDRRFYCRHWPKGLEGINVIEENPFCSYGERREENAAD